MQQDAKPENKVDKKDRACSIHVTNKKVCAIKLERK
jgi:hypothetical protein